MIDLFGNDTQPEETKKPANKSGVSMYGNLTALYGKTPGKKCKDCKHCCRFRYGNTFYKCRIADPGFKTGPSGDWRVNWDACGKFENE